MNRVRRVFALLPPSSAAVVLLSSAAVLPVQDARGATGAIESTATWVPPLSGARP